MALPHVAPGEITRLEPLGERLTDTVSTALFKAAQLEVVRTVLPRGHTMREHRVQGEITLQCMEGALDLTVDGRTQRMQAGDWRTGPRASPMRLRPCRTPPCC